MNVLVKPTDARVKRYYDALASFDAQGVRHEMAIRAAFQRLLEDVAARTTHWTVLAELGEKAGGRVNRPDATLRDGNYLPRGHWEAKDPDDDLDAEIARKRGRGYPLANTIFENSRRAVLFQNGAEAFRADLTDRGQLATLLHLFFAHVPPNIESFEKAISAFRQRVPDLAHGLDGKIKDAHRANRPFEAAFGAFYRLCQESLNPNLRRDAVDEMLIQHLLTERLIRRVLGSGDFVRRNVIAAEVERVIDALVSKDFSRERFLASLDPFYVAIEGAAETLTDYSEKQHFLNSVYEQFFQGYSVKVADTHGIVYTPQPIVDFMCASVVEALRSEFGKTLGDEDVFVVDPATGTGSFVANLLRRVPRRDLPGFYRKRLFANEVMLMPYYIASLNVERTYYDLTGTYEPFDGLCFVDTLDLVKDKQIGLFLTEANTRRIDVQHKAPITVVLGNPPYNAHQLSENDNNKNRRYDVIDGRVRETYAKDSKATNKNALSDAYVKFFRWAMDRLNGRDGIVCYVSNNSFTDGQAFDGIRKHLLADFTRVYHLDLHGNVRRNPKLSGTTHNVMGIQVGVGITLAVRRRKHRGRKLFYHRVPEDWRREEKLSWLAGREKVSGVKWMDLKPDARHTWIVPGNTAAFESFPPIGTKKSKNAKGADGAAVFKTYSGGVKTNRDDVVYDFDRERLAERVAEFTEAYNAEVDRYKRAKGKPPVDEFVRYDRIKWSRDLKLDLQRGNSAEFDERKIRRAAYRPFTAKALFFDRVVNEEVYVLPSIFPTPKTEAENRVLCVSDLGFRAPYSVLATNVIPDLHLLAASDAFQCFPFYVYDEDGTNRRENVTDWALAAFRKRYGNPRIGKWDVFHYVYGLLHHPGYRETFAANLKRELARIPLAPDFRAFADAGRKLADLHVNYEAVKPYPLRWVEAKGRPQSLRVEDRMRLSKDKASLVVNPSLTLADIPPEALAYRLGNRSALEWVIDQYRVTRDAAGRVVSDPNREDDPEYVVRLVERVARVSVETVAIVAGLPETAW